MTTGASHDDGFDEKGAQRAPQGQALSPSSPTSTSAAPPPSAACVAKDRPPALATETPLPLCLTHVAHAASRSAAAASQIPPAPKLPRFSVPAGRTPPAPNDEAAPNSEACLGLPTDRVLPGSPALVSTFRPKPKLRARYSVTHTCQEERVYAPKRTRKANAPPKRGR